MLEQIAVFRRLAEMVGQVKHQMRQRITHGAIVLGLGATQVPTDSVLCNSDVH